MGAVAFPDEAFVQQAIEAYLIERGFQIDDGGYIDLKCHSPELKQRWIIEAKGQTKNIGLDFNTGLGQLLKSMHDPATLYGLAILDTQQFVNQCQKVSKRIRSTLQLHWLLVRSDGTIKLVKPDDELV